MNSHCRAKIVIALVCFRTNGTHGSRDIGEQTELERLKARRHKPIADRLTTAIAIACAQYSDDQRRRPAWRSTGPPGRTRKAVSPRDGRLECDGSAKDCTATQGKRQINRRHNTASFAMIGAGMMVALTLANKAKIRQCSIWQDKPGNINTGVRRRRIGHTRLLAKRFVSERDNQQ